MDTILKKTETISSDVSKTKQEIRSVAKDKLARKKQDGCESNTNFRKRAIGPVEFIEQNQSKITSMLEGERDQFPMDLGKLLTPEGRVVLA